MGWLKNNQSMQPNTRLIPQIFPRSYPLKMWMVFVLRDRAGKAAHRSNKNHGYLSAEARRQAVRKGQKIRNPLPPAGRVLLLADTKQ